MFLLEKTPSPELVKIQTPHSITPEQKVPSIKGFIYKKEKFYFINIFILEITYKILIQTDSFLKDNSYFYIIIHGQNNQTNKLYLKDSIPSNKKSEFQFKTIDIGKV